MTLESIALSIQVLAIGLLTLSACVIPLLYTFWKEKFKK